MYSIVKGKLFQMSSGTVACTGLVVHKIVNTKDEARTEVKALFDSGETDLIITIDLATGKACEDV